MTEGPTASQLRDRTRETSYEVRDSGRRCEFASGMVRDTADGKANYLLVRPGPMLHRWAAHLTKAEEKYPPVSVGVANWTQADGQEELERFRESAARHFEQWLAGELDEDHAAALFFNVNGAEYVRDRLDQARGGDAQGARPTSSRPSRRPEAS